MAEISRPLNVTAGDVIPAVPNLVATISSFLFMMILPWACYWVTGLVIGEEGLAGDLAAIFMNASLLEDAAIALGTSFLFLVIGVILQFWQHQKPFADRWPVALAFPVFFALLLPEVLFRKSPLFVWILFGATIPLAFSVHWSVLVASREAME